MVSYSLEVSRGYVRLARTGARPTRSRMPSSFVRRDGRWVEREPDAVDPDAVPAEGSDDWGDGPEPLDADLEIEADRLRHPRRGDGGMSARSRMNMRRLFVSLPWELLGPRPALVSLTYPGVWEPWVPDGRVWEAHRRAFERRWVRRWSEPLVGVWVKEFQTSGRPHLHLYVGLPAGMADDDYVGLRERTLLRRRLEREHGVYKGRNLTPAPGIIYGGEFGTWLRQTWSDVVGTSAQPGEDWRIDALKGATAHREHGVDVAVMFWTDHAEQHTDRTIVAQYLAREAGKWRQKQPPDGFERIGRFYGVWGRTIGFRPEATTVPLDAAVAVEVETRLARWVNLKLIALRKGQPTTTTFSNRRPGDGVTAFGLGPDQAARIIRWSEQAATRRRSRGAARGDEGEAFGDLPGLLATAERNHAERRAVDGIRPAAEGAADRP